MWAHMTLFYASGPDLAVAWSYIAAAQPLAQVGPAPACATGRLDAWDHFHGTQHSGCCTRDTLLRIVAGYGGAHRNRAAADRCLLSLHVASMQRSACVRCCLKPSSPVSTPASSEACLLHWW